VDGALDALCERAAAAAGFDAFAGCTAALLELARSDVVTDVVAARVRAVAESAQSFVPGTTHDHWPIREHAGATLELVRVPRSDDELRMLLHGSAHHRLVTPLREPSTLFRYRHTSGSAELFDRSEIPSAAEREVVPVGAVVALRAFFDVTEWAPSAEPQVVLVLESPAVFFQMWSYDRETRVPRQTVSADLGQNRIERALRLLAELGHTPAAATVAALYEHPAHHIRWAAVRAAMELDEAVGTSVLRKAASDPHPHVARAARRHLDELGLDGDRPWP
jgi:hypothetical protein